MTEVSDFGPSAFARAICESEGRNWLSLGENTREDVERWLAAGRACAALTAALAVAPKPKPKPSRNLTALCRIIVRGIQAAKSEDDAVLFLVRCATTGALPPAILAALEDGQ